MSIIIPRLLIILDIREFSDQNKKFFDKLKDLNDELDIYQAHLYGIDSKRQMNKFEKWK